jgi:hypothetical protein
MQWAKEKGRRTIVSTTLHNKLKNEQHELRVKRRCSGRVFPYLNYLNKRFEISTDI